MSPIAVDDVGDGAYGFRITAAVTRSGAPQTILSDIVGVAVGRVGVSLTVTSSDAAGLAQVEIHAAAGPGAAGTRRGGAEPWPSASTLTDAGVDVRLSGMDVVWSMRGAISVPWSEVVGARVVDAKTAKRRLRWRVGGTSWPARVNAGRFTVRDEPGVREFWVTYRDPEFLEIETTREQPKRIVLQVPDRAELAAAIDARVRVP